MTFFKAAIAGPGRNRGLRLKKLQAGPVARRQGTGKKISVLPNNVSITILDPCRELIIILWRYNRVYLPRS